jgi:hypothetical protein
MKVGRRSDSGKCNNIQLFGGKNYKNEARKNNEVIDGCCIDNWNVAFYLRGVRRGEVG